ncbi:T9SS type A sorting domain-containing protein [bacterium]|nr:T9SS type A sorting domain-containing protein [bacterium]
MRSRCLAPSLLLAIVLLVAHGSPAATDQPHPFWRTGPQKAAVDVPSAERLLVKQAPLLADGSPALQAARLAGERTPDTVRGIAIMVAFSDTTFHGHPDDGDGVLPESGQSEFLYAAHDSVFYDHLLQDVADYYDAVSGGRFTLDYEVHGEVVQLDQPMGYYGDHPEEGEQPVLLSADAVAAVDPDIDFSAYDTVLLIHAGAGEETDANNDSPEQIYSSYIGFEDLAEAVEDSVLAAPWLPTDDHGPDDGVRHVLILPECEYQDPGVSGSGYFGSLGVYCFEMGLRLGMLSLFDFTDNDSQGIGQLGLMGFGLWTAGGLVPPQPCAFNKYLMGWIDPVRIDATTAETWTLDPAAQVAGPRACARVDLTGTEYYLLEYRRQDPDGNNDFTFTGDLNGNTAPDFFDASNPDGSGLPVGYFDPAEDTDERYTGAEWDFFLTDNAARPEGVLAAGSGLLIWHVDEGVIRGVWDAERNLFNADPEHKSVDLEEADGIQDLDTRQGGVYWLGADVDTWKAEGSDTFGPATRPDTRTNAGVATGLVIDGISAVVADSAHVFNVGEADEYTGILYHDTMSFRVAYEDPTAVPDRQLDLVGVDVTGSHLRAARLLPADDAPTVVMAADSGRVYALTPELVERIDHDGDAATIEPLTVGTDAAGEPARWIGPPAIGDLEPGREGLEIVIAAAGGLYAFGADGAPLATGTVPGTDVGLVAPAVGRLTQPAVLLPRTGDIGDPGRMALAVDLVETASDTTSHLRFVDAAGDPVVTALEFPDARVVSVPVTGSPGRLYVALRFPGQPGAVHAIGWSQDQAPSGRWSVQTPVEIGARPMTVVPDGILVSSDEGRGGKILLDDDGIARSSRAWPGQVEVASPVGAGGAVLGGDRFGRIGDAGAWQTGWPVVPRAGMTSAGAEPLALVDAAHPDDPRGFLFAARDGRLFLADRDGRMVAGWPLAGPAEPVVAPAIVDGGAGLVLIAVGVTPEVAGVDPQTDELRTRPVTRLRAWGSDVFAALGADVSPPQGAIMSGGSAEGRRMVGALVSEAAIARAGGLEDSHVCYPQPLTSGTLRVRAVVSGRAEVRVVIYDLQGEVVRASGPTTATTAGPFEVAVDMDGVASGLYVCKLQVGSETSVKTIAVAR